MTDTTEKSVHELSELLASKELSSVELTQSFLDRIDTHGEGLGAFLHVASESALEQAARSDERRASGKTLSVFDGVPVALKDIFLTEGIPTTCSSKILQCFVPPYD